MADYGLFLGWGAVVTGREAKSLEVFGESVEWYGKLQADGRIESFEVVLLDPHGGDLDGFVLLRGTQEQIAGLQADPEFRRQTARAALVVQSLGGVRAYMGEALASEMQHYQQAIADIA
jgi:hypothetical protein